MIYRLKPAAATVGALAQVPAGKECYLTGWACNTSVALADSICVYVLKSGETDITNTEIYSELKVPANDTFSFTPLHLDAGESVHVKSKNGTTVFTLTGQEVAK